MTKSEEGEPKTETGRNWKNKTSQMLQPITSGNRKPQSISYRLRQSARLAKKPRGNRNDHKLQNDIVC